MNLEFLIAKRLGAATQKSFSRSILRLAVIAIALSMMVMIVATAIVAGFKNTISEKIFGFWGHIHITSSYSPSSYAYESSPMNLNQDFYPSIDTIGQVYYMAHETDLAASFLANSANPFFWTGVLCLLFAFVFFVFIKKIKLRYRTIFALALGLIGSILLASQQYEIVQKDVMRQTQGGIRHIQYYIHKEGIIKTDDQIEGVVLRGIGEDYDWDFLKAYLKEGAVLTTTGKESTNGILISEATANRLKLKVGDSFLIYFVQEGTSLGRKFKVSGIFKTGLEEYDRRFALVDVRELQELNNWRPYRSFGTEVRLSGKNLFLKGLTAATAPEDGGWQYVMNNLIEGQLLNFEDNNSLEAIIPHQIAQDSGLKIGDTMPLHYTDNGNIDHTFSYKVAGIYRAPDAESVQQTIFVNWHSIDNLNKKLPPQISGFEIFVEDIQDLDAFGNYVNYVTLLGKEQYANTIKELEPNIFNWLSLTDMNERIILLLMILVSIINMTTSLMILILERTNMIGILKALGAQNWSIRKIFLYNAAYIIGYGLFWGNIIGIGLCLLQMQFGIITLPEDLYYVAVAPVEINVLTILLLNIGTMAITLSVLVIPSWLVAKIDPVKAIRFS